MMSDQVNKQGGAMLIEVLLSILIFSFGILGLVGLQVVATQNSVSAENRTAAALLANDLIAQMWLRKKTNLDADEITVWQSRIKASGLGNASGAVATDADGVATITVQWKPPYEKSAASDHRYVTKVAID